MTPVEALKLALSKEIEAVQMYTKMGNDHPAIKDIFFALIIEEQKHKKLIEEKIIELTK